MLMSFGALLVAAGVVSLITGKTYYRRVIQRRDEPLLFWCGAVGLLTIGGLCLIGLAVCPRG
jgi:hypothetical protein